MRKIVLAYSGGLDTSVILKWLAETYKCPVVAFAADIGQGEELDHLEAKALSTGAEKVVIEDLQETFVRDYVFPAFRANAIYEGQYLLGTSLARPLIAKRQVEVAEMEGADALSHGATGKGNDQVRFELTYQALAPHLHIIAPWRLWSLSARSRPRRNRSICVWTRAMTTQQGTRPSRTLSTQPTFGGSARRSWTRTSSQGIPLVDGW